jgi:hypothetical protein
MNLQSSAGTGFTIERSKHGRQMLMTIPPGVVTLVFTPDRAREVAKALMTVARDIERDNDLAQAAANIINDPDQDTISRARDIIAMVREADKREE